MSLVVDGKIFITTIGMQWYDRFFFQETLTDLKHEILPKQDLILFSLSWESLIGKMEGTKLGLIQQRNPA